MRIFQCLNCGQEAKALGKRDQDKAKFCGNTCRLAWQAQNAKCWINCEACGKRARNANPGARFCSKSCAQTGPNNARWLDIPRVKTCEGCGKEYGPKPFQTTDFAESRFCSRECGWKGQKYLRGEENPQYSPTARRRNRNRAHERWREQVFARDLVTCQACGVRGIEMHAHHIKSHKDHPDLRYDVSNGITLCYACHWKEHSASSVNGVNSGNIAPGQAGDNPEPSDGRKLVEGVTVRGRAYRRFEGECGHCGQFVSRPLSRASASGKMFCSYACSGASKRKTPKAVTSLKSAPAAS